MTKPTNDGYDALESGELLLYTENDLVNTLSSLEYFAASFTAPHNGELNCSRGKRLCFSLLVSFQLNTFGMLEAISGSGIANGTFFSSQKFDEKQMTVDRMYMLLKLLSAIFTTFLLQGMHAIEKKDIEKSLNSDEEPKLASFRRELYKSPMRTTLGALLLIAACNKALTARTQLEEYGKGELRSAIVLCALYGLYKLQEANPGVVNNCLNIGSILLSTLNNCITPVASLTKTVCTNTVSAVSYPFFSFSQKVGACLSPPVEELNNYLSQDTIEGTFAKRR